MRMGSVMLETDDFQRLADECLGRAGDPEITQQQRQLLIEMATAWKRLDASKVEGDRDSR